MSVLDQAKVRYEGLNAREQKLVLLMGVVFAAMLVLLPLYLIFSGMADLRAENEETRKVLREIARSSEQIEEQKAARAAAEALYNNPAPPLGSFLEAKAKAAGYERALKITEEPTKEDSGFRRLHTRASLQNIGLVALVNMMTEIKNSPHPVAIERIEIEHYQNGDQYNVEVGIVSFEKVKSSKKASK